jgi:hypothetical protein
MIWEKKGRAAAVSEATEASSKWQPVLVILRNGGGRLECTCGALAVIVIGKLNPDEDNKLEGVDYWCQVCYHKAQQEVQQ